MKQNTLVVFLTCFLFRTYAMDINLIPSFQETNITLKISTNTSGYVSDRAYESGSNVVYNLIGQVFTNSDLSGFSGKIPITSLVSNQMDRSTPWKTLAELMAIYHGGCDSNLIYSVHAPNSKSFLDSIYHDQTILNRYKDYGMSITNMTVLVGFEIGTNNFFVVTKINTSDSTISDTLPFCFVKTNGLYLISTLDELQPREVNIGVFLNTNIVENIIH